MWWTWQGMAKLVLVCGVRLAAGALQLCEERREFGTGIRYVRLQPWVGHSVLSRETDAPAEGARFPSDTPSIPHPQETRSGLFSPTSTVPTSRNFPALVSILRSCTQINRC
jgi:hypothetical protein